MRVAFQIKNTLFVALVLAFGLFLTACSSTKITDPADPRFNPGQFRFEDYIGDTAKDRIETLFPTGTPKSFVDEALVESGKAGVQKIDKIFVKQVKINGSYQPQYKHLKNSYIYRYQNKSAGIFGISWKIIVEYDEENRVLGLIFSQSSIKPL
jgi:hypothetical protein